MDQREYSNVVWVRVRHLDEERSGYSAAAESLWEAEKQRAAGFKLSSALA
jgi:hypothetical protein